MYLYYRTYVHTASDVALLGESREARVVAYGSHDKVSVLLKQATGAQRHNRSRIRPGGESVELSDIKPGSSSVRTLSLSSYPWCSTLAPPRIGTPSCGPGDKVRHS